MPKKSKAKSKSKSGIVGRNDLVVAIAKATGHSQTVVLEVLNNLIGSIRLTVKAGTPVRLNGFGVFRLSQIKARRSKVFTKGRKQVLKNLPAVTVARFKPSGEFLK